MQFPQSPHGPLRRFLDNPVAIERGLGVLLWSGLIVVLLTKSSL
ncbi:MAG: hypothetical protein AAFZ87_02445 [Planctomycetota bacterium]